MILQKHKVNYLKLMILTEAICCMFISNVLNAQQSTSGPVRPIGVSKGIVMDKSEMSKSNIKVIYGVPSYLWYRGCGPTSLGMVTGYYDSHGFPDLIEGDALSQSYNVNSDIANDQHYSDFSLPLDYTPNLIQDKSELGGAHTSDCIADFMQTSWSSEGNYWGWSWSSDISPAFIKYINLKNPLYRITTSYKSYSSSDSWNLYKTEIDYNRPVVILVDTDGDGKSDHFVTGIGYDSDQNLYAIYDTWDNNIHWYEWQGMSSGNIWGIYGFNIFNIKSEPTLNDYDGNVYKTIKIGDQVWMAENLKTTKFNDGTSITLVSDDANWAALKAPAYCWYDNKIANKDTYGALYNWYTVSAGKLCPAGWHVPSDDDLKTLISYLDGVSVTGGKLKEVGFTHWTSPNTGATNESGFTALPGGLRSAGTSIFNSLGLVGIWWGYDFAWYVQNSISTLTESAYAYEHGLSVRCIKDVITSIANIEATSIIRIFPNPVTGLMSVEYINENDGFRMINIFDSQGRLLAKEKALLPTQQIDFSKYDPGLYILEFIGSTGKSKRIKIIKQ